MKPHIKLTLLQKRDNDKSTSCKQGGVSNEREWHLNTHTVNGGALHQSSCSLDNRHREKMPGLRRYNRPFINNSAMLPFTERHVISPFLDPRNYTRLRLYRLPPGEQCGIVLQTDLQPICVGHASIPPAPLQYVTSMSHSCEFVDGWAITLVN